MLLANEKSKFVGKFGVQALARAEPLKCGVHAVPPWGVPHLHLGKSWSKVGGQGATSPNICLKVKYFSYVLPAVFRCRVLTSLKPDDSLEWLKFLALYVRQVTGFS